MDKFPHRFSIYIQDKIGPNEFKSWGLVECLSVMEHEVILREERAKIWEEAATMECFRSPSEDLHEEFLKKAKYERENFQC